MHAAVLGSPIMHSLSPAIHTRAYEILGFDGEYVANEVTQEALLHFLTAERLSDKLSLGFSLTMPLKEEICSAKFSSLISIDDRSRTIQSANTLYRDGDRWCGTSTDVSGVEYLLGDHAFSKVSILGSGGTARAVLAARQMRGAEISLYRRSPFRDAFISSAFPQLKIIYHEWADVRGCVDADLLVNTVPSSAVESLNLQGLPLLLDAIYSPWMPALSRAQSSAQRDLISGIDLLCAQAMFQVTLMTKIGFEYDSMFTELKKVALQKLM